MALLAFQPGGGARPSSIAGLQGFRARRSPAVVGQSRAAADVPTVAPPVATPGSTTIGERLLCVISPRPRKSRFALSISTLYTEHQVMIAMFCRSIPPARVLVSAVPALLLTRCRRIPKRLTKLDPPLSAGERSILPINGWPMW